jgi:hypothetical protein
MFHGRYRDAAVDAFFAAAAYAAAHTALMIHPISG